MNLLEIPWIGKAFRSRLYPTLFQWITVLLFVVLLVSMLFGPDNSGQNFGMAFTWTVWWPLLPLSFVVFGRLWCAVCPFAWITDRVQRVVGVRLAVPRFLRRYGPWVIAGLFIVVSYLDEAWGFDDDARKTAYLLLVVLATVVFFAAFYERRTFCRHVCFIGAFASLYSRAGVLELHADPARCRSCRTQDCYRGGDGGPGCPVFLFAPGVANSASCHLCASCVKICPHDAVRLDVRKPTAELWRIRHPHVREAVLVMIVTGVVLIEQAARLGGWNHLVMTVAGMLRVNPYISFPFVYAALLAVFIGVPLLGLLSASWASQALGDGGTASGVGENFSLFGWAVVPLLIGSHVAYCLDLLLMRSRSVPAALAAMVGRFPGGVRMAWMAGASAMHIEIGALVLGGAGSLYVAFRMARRFTARRVWAAYAPHVLFLLGLLGANLYAVVATVR